MHSTVVEWQQLSLKKLGKHLVTETTLTLRGLCKEGTVHLVLISSTEASLWQNGGGQKSSSEVWGS